MNKIITFNEILSLDELKVYHGSDTIIKEPKIIQPTRALDFGKGFYTTINKNQAESFAKKVQDRNGSKQTHISIYNLNIDMLKKQYSLYFDKPDKNWLDFVSSNRNGIYNNEKYDVIYGPVANDTIFRTFIAYQNGILNAEETIERLKIKELINQLVFTNNKSLCCLKFSGELK